MAGEEAPPGRGSAPPRPTISLPPRSSMEAMFAGGGIGFSPGPMTLVSSFFSDSEDSKSFSQLLAGAMASPAAVPAFPADDSGGGDGEFRFKQNRPAGLVVSQQSMFMVPSGLSPASLLDSPALFSPGQGSFSMTHQQALAQVTAQAAHALVKDSSEISYSDQRSQPSTFTGDKPADDGFNWRKYGQKQVKGSEFPRSYYKCTHPNCPVKKKVERSHDGQVTEIIYKGQHNHQRPQSNKRGKDKKTITGNSSNQENPESEEPCQVPQEHPSATSDSEEGGDAETGMNEKDEDEPEPKRRNTEIRISEAASSQKTVTEPRIIVQTTSEVDLLDDGFRWRKYGQKVVKGNPYPRSYYKCTTPGCNVRKHVERASSDPKAVITTYEGKHNHDVPVAKTSSHNLANNNATNPKSSNAKQASMNKTNRGNNDRQPIPGLRLKEEHIT